MMLLYSNPEPNFVYMRTTDIDRLVAAIKELKVLRSAVLDGYLDQRNAAKYVGLSVNQFRSLMNEELFIYSQRGRKYWFKISDLDATIQAFPGRFSRKVIGPLKKKFAA